MKAPATIAILATCATLPGVAQQPDDAPELSSQAREFLEEKATITNVWEVNEHLTGVALELSPGEGMTVFVDASGQYLLSGALIDASTGENIAEASTRRHFPAPGPEDMYEEAEDMAWVRTGEKGEGEPIYIIADTQCSYCHETAREIAKRGIEREIRWILVGFLGPKSSNQAAALLTMPPREASRATWAILTGQADGAPETADPDGAAMVSENERWAEKWRVSGTPVLLVRHQGAVHRVVGLPQPELWETIR